MIELGMAWHYKDYEKEQSKTDRELYGEAEASARETNTGLWVQRKAVSPWIFRQK